MSEEESDQDFFSEALADDEKHGPIVDPEPVSRVEMLGRKIFFLSALWSLVAVVGATAIYASMTSEPISPQVKNRHHDPSHDIQAEEKSWFHLDFLSKPKEKPAPRSWDASTEQAPKPGTARVVVAGKPTDIELPQEKVLPPFSNAASGTVRYGSNSRELKTGIALLDPSARFVELHLFDTDLSEKESHAIATLSAQGQPLTPLPVLTFSFTFKPFVEDCEKFTITTYSIHLGAALFQTKQVTAAPIVKNMAFDPGKEIRAISCTRSAGEHFVFSFEGNESVSGEALTIAVSTTTSFIQRRLPKVEEPPKVETAEEEEDLFM